MIYGRCYDVTGQQADFAGNSEGYELKHDIFQQFFPGNGDRKTFFELIEVIHKLYSSLYRGQETMGRETLVAFSFVKNQNSFLLVEYKTLNESPNMPKDDHLGILLRLEQNEKGINLSKLAHKCITILKAGWCKFAEGGNVSFIDASLEKELKLLR